MDHTRMTTPRKESKPAQKYVVKFRLQSMAAFEPSPQLITLLLDLTTWIEKYLTHAVTTRCCTLLASCIAHGIALSECVGKRGYLHMFSFLI